MTRAPWLSERFTPRAHAASVPRVTCSSRLRASARSWAFGAAAALWLGLAVLAPPALADAPTVAVGVGVGELVPKLQSADSRVRAATVLQLGATNDDSAVAPLCQSLNDDAEIVRISAATALRRLGRAASTSCLKERLAREPGEGAKLQIARAIQSIEAGSAPAAAAPQPGPYEPPSRPNAKYYVALSSVAASTDRPQSEVEAVVLKAVRAKLEAMPEFQIAPMHESPEAARKALSSRKVKGFFLSISVEKFDYSGGNLRAKVNVAIFSYPGRSLLAPAGNAATMPGVAPGNKRAEDELLTMLAGAVIKQFASSAPAM